MLLGAHISIAGGIFNAPIEGKRATCDTIQIFTKSANQWKAKPLSDKEIARFFEEQKNTGVTVACAHDSYLINLGSPDEESYKKSYDSFQIELERCHLLKISLLVMHPGSHLGNGEENGLKRIAAAFNLLFERLPDNKTVVCLETTAGQGTNLGYKFDQLAQIIDLVEDKSRMGICLDTCHIFAAGYPLQSKKDYEETIRQFDRTLGLNRLKIIHINDSKKPFGSKVDRHEHIGQGEMGLESFRHILNDKRLSKIPKILETPKGEELLEDIENLRLLRSLIEK
ncbi:MAG: deoxyribonuclease IV [candidate division Zixibacteria bacterium]|nr:deoxyribonuclease IV [candidate division Zixibacteria bacterium]